jgi:hypothetical protein
MAAVFVCNALNLPTDYENSSAYVAGWLKEIREDKREFLHCAADAQRIADHVLAYPRISLRQPALEPPLSHNFPEFLFFALAAVDHLAIPDWLC